MPPPPPTSPPTPPPKFSSLPPHAVDDEIDQLFDELDQLLKNAEVGATVAERGVNVSLAMTLADGVRAYLQGDKERAVADLGTAVEEIESRAARTRGRTDGEGAAS
jgi:hypothetical protein